MMSELRVSGQNIRMIRVGNEDYFSLTDIAKFRADEPNAVIRSWISSKDTLSFLYVWESLNNPAFDRGAHELITGDAGSRAFSISPTKWVENTGAIGLVSRAGRSGGTYGHSDVSLEFAAWISAEFRLYIISEYKRLKEVEALRESPEWMLQREVARLNYRIQTDAIKKRLIPPGLSQEQAGFRYADEADMLNVVVFGMRAKEWKQKNPNSKGNMRDYASPAQLLVIGNLQGQNATMIEQQMPQEQRMQALREIAVRQLDSLESVNANSRLEDLSEKKRVR